MMSTSHIGTLWAKIQGMIGFGQPAICYSCAAKFCSILGSSIGGYIFPRCVHHQRRQFEMRQSKISAFVSLTNALCILLITLYEFHVSYLSENGFWSVNNIYITGMLLFGLSHPVSILITFTKANLYSLCMSHIQAVIIETNRVGNHEFLKLLPKYRLRWLLYGIISISSCSIGVYYYCLTNAPIHLCTTIKLYPLCVMILNIVIIIEAITDLNGICYNIVRQALESEIRHSSNPDGLTLQQSFDLVFMCYRSIDSFQNVVNPGLSFYVVVIITLSSTLFYVFILTILTFTVTPFMVYYFLLLIFVGSSASYICYIADRYKAQVCNNPL